VLSKLIVRPGTRARLADRRADETFGWTKEDARVETARLLGELSVLQSRLYAEGTRAVLLVLQAMDAAGKDGTIRRVFTGVNPQGVVTQSLKAPSATELAHDYLWRVHAVMPRRGEIGVFNRSHYEDVLVARVRGLVPESVWRPRYRHIRELERMLADEGTTVLKVHLQISRDEQGRRLQARIDDAESRWKFQAVDLEDRQHWDAYQEAYEEALTETSTRWAPWYVVPADRRWSRDLCVMRLLVDTLERMNPQLPTPTVDLTGVVVDPTPSRSGPRK
jgi:PPK2 family polyphosphate:nucleotide phosphotransferase